MAIVGMGALLLSYIPFCALLLLLSPRRPSEDLLDAVGRKFYDVDEVVKFLEADPESVNAKNQYGETALHIAARNGRVEVLRLLLARGADVNARDRYGQTGLHAAISDCEIAAATYLISQGADVNAADNKGNTPLHIAARWAFTDCVEVLIANGAQVDKRNKEGKTALDLAREQLAVQQKAQRHVDRWNKCISLLQRAEKETSR